MQVTLELDDALVKEAADTAGVHEGSSLVHEALRALIQREAARRVAELGGSEPAIRRVPRRRDAHELGIAL